MIWDDLLWHRSRFVKNNVESLDRHVVLEQLPAYAAELNPAEYIWAYRKQYELGNLCLHTVARSVPSPEAGFSPCNVGRGSSPRAGTGPGCRFAVTYLLKTQ